ncbi:hypothetical protein NSU18_18095 [Paenibacillus sp. FSL H8-0048]|uniref:hypothetical protein n=1 Tax=Paenibacillus sp. FSL H8-0048 TaxID=2954508 RepID=UPI0030FC3E89
MQPIEIGEQDYDSEADGQTIGKTHLTWQISGQCAEASGKTAANNAIIDCLN